MLWEDPEVVGDIYLPHVYVYTISSASIGGMRQFVSQIPLMGVILMRYWMVGQERNMRSTVMCKNKLITGDFTLRRILMIIFEMLLSNHFVSIRIIGLIVSSSGSVDFHVYKP